MRPRSRARPALSIFVCVAAAFAVSTPGAAAQTDTTFSVPRGGSMTLRLQAGSLRIGSWDRDAVRVRSSARIAIRTGAPQGALQVSGVGTTRGQHELVLPGNFAVAISGTQLNVSAANAGGRITITTTTGNVVIEGGTGDVVVETLTGSVRVVSRTGDLRLNASNLGIEVVDSRGNVRAETVNGAIALSGVRGDSVFANSVNGGITFEGALEAGASYSFTAHNGSITLRLAGSPDATFHAVSLHGTIESDFEVRLARMGRAFDFTLGAGTANVRLETFNGSIHLRRSRSDGRPRSRIP